ncbi:flagellar biosynthesis protein FlhF [Chitinivorax tropicus]|uniref:Flagellar biosynthesis protein FlhF n=1 Tax=Chitinivorax tropicus TaxID=714531 RepID=A0A840MK00_9PROT|nr:flagellar biosynthesis protein FlhF [Chitinivorax tropicus]MBB5017825.1 flagellar biosynthesis protein FlhF [Chitinivorax tropicus]
MIVKKFYGTNTRDALRQVRDALGPDALILANRQIAGGGVEIMAVSDTDVATLTTAPSGTLNNRPKPVVSAPPADTPRGRQLQNTYALPDDDPGDADAFVTAISSPPPAPARTTVPQEPASKPPAAPMPFTPPKLAVEPPVPAKESKTEPTLNVKPAQRYVVEQDAPKPNGAGKAAKADDSVEQMQSIMSELKALRTLMEGQLAGFAWSDMQKHAPAKLEVFRRMLSFGFSPALCRQLLEHIPANYDADTGLRWVRAALQRNLPVIAAGDDLIESGGIYALVGPTGVGKTTTVAKLAARCTLKHGASKVALITTDSYRIGAHDQLRIYGKILGVPVYSVKDESDLQLTLSDLGNRFMVLIDTVGMSQRDKRLTEQIAMLTSPGTTVRRILLLSATAQGSTLDDVVRCYQADGLSGCILTKIDEAALLGDSLDVIIRHRLTLHYVTNGQRVPEDLHLANPLYLLDRALRMMQDPSAYVLRPDEYPLQAAARASAVSSPLDVGGIHG